MRKSKLIMLVLIGIMIATIAVSFVGCGPKTVPVGSDWIDTSDLDVKLWDNNYYIGTKVVKDGAVVAGGVDLKKGFPNATFAKEGDTATLEGTVLTINTVGEFKLTVTEGTATTTLNIKGVDAVNCVESNDLVVALADKEVKNAIAIQADIKMEEGKGGLLLQDNLYGNGYTLNVYDVVKPAGTEKKPDFGQSFMDIKGEDTIVRDLKTTGKVFEKKADNDQVGLSTLEYSGGFYFVKQKVGDKKSTVSFINCVMENGQKMIYARSNNVNVEGVVFRNSCDNGLCIETGKGGATINVKNTVMVNEVVAGMLSCGWEGTNADEDKTIINISGFLDIFNWKEASTAKLMPSTEQFNGLVNSKVGEEAKKDNFSSKLYKDGSNYYMHAGIIVLATGSLKQNKAVINGIESIGYSKMQFPLPKWAMSLGIVKTLDLYCYTATSGKGFTGVKPTDKFDANNYYELLQNGKKA